MNKIRVFYGGKHKHNNLGYAWALLGLIALAQRTFLANYLCHPLQAPPGFVIVNWRN